MRWLLAIALSVSLARGARDAADHPAGPPHTARATRSNHVKYLTWYMSNGKGEFNQSELDTAPTSAHANLQMASNLTFLVESSKQLGLPGLINLQKSRWANSDRDRRPDAATHPHIWNDKEVAKKRGNGLAAGWEAAVDELVQVLTPLAPAHANHLRGVMIGDELVW